uniref:Uncharacterized protein n=1 Tax=Myotis myotis TaxID=51298 RepID=A0A7J7SR83_MYOMY|nr:hypothetical protein mMyoMyo1_009349 [Myotis myotis]
MLQCLDPFFPSHHFSFYLLFSSIHSAVYQLIISSFLFSVFKGFFNIPGSFMEQFVLWGFFWIYYALEFLIEGKVHVCAQISFLIQIPWLSFHFKVIGYASLFYSFLVFKDLILVNLAHSTYPINASLG